MITFKTPLRYKYYFLENFYRMFGSLVEKLFLVFFILLSSWHIWLKDYKLAIFVILIPLFFYFILPLIKLIYARTYYKMDTIEYFFDDDSFGYCIGEYTMKIKKEKVEYIAAHPNHLLIKIFKQKLYFVDEKQDIKNTSKLLSNSAYKNLMSK